MERQLLCTFTAKNFVISTLRSILETYIIMYDTIYIYENNDERQQLLCVYNIGDVVQCKGYLPNTISMHRKKVSNTLYTINALNALIQENNNGVLDIKYVIDWESYRDHAFIIADGQLKKIKIKFREAMRTKTRE